MATANQYSPFGLPSAGITPDNPLAPEYLALERQKKIADLLMQKGQQLPEGQMVSGHYVAPSLTQQLNPLLNAYMGGNMAEQNEARTAKLGQLLRGQGVEEINTFSDLMQKDPMAAYKYAAKSTNPQLQKLGFEKMLPEDITLGEGQKRIRINPQGGQTVLAQGEGKAHVVGNSLIVDGKEVYKGREKPVQIDTGTAIQFIDPETRQVVFSTPKQHVFAPHANQIIDTPNGMIEYNPNNRSFNPVMVNGQAVMGTKGNLPEGATSQVTGVQNVKSALGDLKTRLDTIKPQDMVNPNKRALMSTDYQNVVLQLKEAMKLGVLNGNDYQILTSMITNPNDPKALLVNKETQLEQINNLSKKLDDMTKNVYKAHQRNVPSNLETPTIPNDLASQAIAELKKRQSGK
jgi:hypothetical protein